MADVMIKSQPCQFDAKGWRPCKKPSDNGWCSEHEVLECVSCGKHATRSCETGMGGLCCGQPLCDDCGHDKEGNHVTKEVLQAIRTDEETERQARTASKTSPERRMNEGLGVPITLFELLKGDWRNEGYELRKAYFLELKHGLMGFFPAVFAQDLKRIIVTADLHLMESVWRTLEPREAKLCEGIAYVNEALGIAYFECDDRENQTPRRMLTKAEFDALVTGEKPFCWAPGLLGRGGPSPQYFLESLVKQATALDPTFRSAAQA